MFDFRIFFKEIVGFWMDGDLENELGVPDRIEQSIKNDPQVDIVNFLVTTDGDH